MEISVDGSPREVCVLPATIGTLICEIKNDLLDGGRVLLSYSVDGRTVDSEYEREISTLPPDAFKALTIETADPKALCLATLDEVRNHIQPIIDESARISELIDTGREVQAFGRIAPCVEVWGAIIKAIHNIAQLMQVDLDRVAVNEEPLSTTLHALVELLQSIKNHINARDLVSIRDAMKHEMPEVAGRIAGQLHALSSQVAAK